MTTTPFHDPHAEPVHPIRIDLDGRTLDPFAGEVQIEERWEIRSTPKSRAAVDALKRAARRWPSVPHEAPVRPEETR